MEIALRALPRTFTGLDDHCDDENVNKSSFGKTQSTRITKRFVIFFILFRYPASEYGNPMYVAGTRGAGGGEAVS